MLAANHPWLNKAKRPMSSSWQCCTLPDILLLRCTQRFLWIQKLSVFSLHWCHRIPNSMSSCSAGRRFEQKTPMSTMVWLRKYPAQTCSKLSKQKIQKPSISKIRNEDLVQFAENFKKGKTNISWLESDIWKNLGRSTHRGTFGMRWLLTILERRCEMWDAKNMQRPCEIPASHRGCSWHSTQRLVATRSLRHFGQLQLTTVKKHGETNGNVWRPRSMHKWWEGWPGPHPETTFAKKTELCT